MKRIANSENPRIFLNTGMVPQRLGRLSEALLYYKAARDFSEPSSEVRKSADRNLGVLEPVQP